MSNSSRLKALLNGKASRALDRAEDPGEVLDDSYEGQLEMLRQVRRGLADIVTARKRIELQGQEIGERHARLKEQARQALDQGQDALARTALERRASLEDQVSSIRGQYDALVDQESRLHETERQLTERVAAFRVEKETIKATYTASAAQVRVNEAVAGIGAELHDDAARVERAREKVLQMQARAAATDELLATGALHGSGDADADLDRRLAATARRSAVDRQLAELKESRDEEGPGPWQSIGAR